MRLREKIQAFGLTDPGRVRDHNEDAIHVEPKRGIALLADGMGGHNAGEVASRMAIQRVAEELHHALDHYEYIAEGEALGYSPETLVLGEAVRTANLEIFRTSRDKPQCHGMGTTLVSVLFYENRLSIAHVGDSRLYRYRERVLDQLTIDHTLLQELVDRGFYSPEEAQISLNKNVITRALGTEEVVHVDLQEELVRKGDLYLLCSDGLNDMIDDERISSTLSEFGDNLEEAANRLVHLANNNGGRDNISVVLVRIDRAHSMKGGWLRKFIEWFD